MARGPDGPHPAPPDQALQPVFPGDCRPLSEVAHQGRSGYSDPRRLAKDLSPSPSPAAPRERRCFALALPSAGRGRHATDAGWPSPRRRPSSPRPRALLPLGRRVGPPHPRHQALLLGSGGLPGHPDRLSPRRPLVGKSWSSCLVHGTGATDWWRVLFYHLYEIPSSPSSSTTLITASRGSPGPRCLITPSSRSSRW